MLSFTTRMKRAHSYRARSASKMDDWPLPIYSFLLCQVIKHISGTSGGASNKRRIVYVFAD